MNVRGPSRYGSAADAEPVGSSDPDLVALSNRFEELTSRLERLVDKAAAAAPEQKKADESMPARLTEAVARLDGRIDLLSQQSRVMEEDTKCRIGQVDRALAAMGETRLKGVYTGESAEIEQMVAEIFARQLALDGDDAPNAVARPYPARSRLPPQAAPAGPDLTSLEQQLREITSRLATLQAPCRAEDIVGVLRKDLAEISRTVNEAMPRRAFEALESEVRALGERLDASRQSGLDSSALSGLENGLAEVRDALRGLAPVGLDATVKTLLQKVDTLASGDSDPAALQQLDTAINGLRGIVAHVASGDALAALTKEVRTLADKIDQSLANSESRTDILLNLDKRLIGIVDAIGTRRPDWEQPPPAALESLMTSISEKLERVRPPDDAPPFLAILEARMAKLVEKLDASETRLGNLQAIEQGMTELIAHLADLRAQRELGSRRTGDAAQPPPAAAYVGSLTRDLAALKENQSETDRRTQDSLEIAHGAIGQVVDRLAMIETDLHTEGRQQGAPSPPDSAPPVPPVGRAPGAAPSGAASAPHTTKAAEPTWGAFDASLPPDTPLEPGSGPPPGRMPPSAAERIAASEAALGTTPVAQAPNPNFILAARRAAQAANAEQAGQRPQGQTGEADPAMQAKTLAQRVKSLFVGVSLVMITIVAVPVTTQIIDLVAQGPTGVPGQPEREARTAADARPSDAAPSVTATQLGQIHAAVGASSSPPTAASRHSVPTFDPAALALAPFSGVVAKPAANADAAGSNTQAVPSHSLDPVTTGGASPRRGDVAASPKPAPAAPAPASTSHLGWPDPLPPTIGGKPLLAGVAAGDPAAAYEVGARFLEGRGVSASLTSAALWFGRAAERGLAPAQFRLGSMYEKGQGVKKDLQEARRLYLPAADKGNAHAMHNLAVMYAEGLDGKPDYATAAQWFSRAAKYGLADSQHNLAILYARGVGVEQNLAESLKWFSLAARGGDHDSAKKRDELAARLDQQSLTAARLAAQTWVADAQPDEATTVKAPPGGWDAAGGATAKQKPHPRSRLQSAHL